MTDPADGFANFRCLITISRSRRLVLPPLTSAKDTGQARGDVGWVVNHLRDRLKVLEQDEECSCD